MEHGFTKMLLAISWFFSLLSINYSIIPIALSSIASLLAIYKTYRDIKKK